MLRGLTSIRPEERRGAVAAFLTIFGILAAHTLLETARDALFLARLPASRLPWVYLIIAGMAVAISQVPWSRRRAGSLGLPALLLTFAAVTLLFWLTRSWRSPAALYALYVWTGLVGSLAVLQFWLVLGDLYTVTQAKRIYGLIGTGSLLGAVAGAGLARFLAASSAASVLVLAAAVTMAATALGPALALRWASAAGPAPASRPRAPLHRRHHPRRLRVQERGLDEDSPGRSWGVLCHRLRGPEPPRAARPAPADGVAVPGARPPPLALGAAHPDLHGRGRGGPRRRPGGGPPAQ